MRRLVSIAFVGLLTAPALPALAADMPDYAPFDPGPVSVEENVPDLEFDLGAGVMLVPEWEGSEDYIASPWPLISIRTLNVGPLNIGGGSKYGLGVRPAFRVRGERDEEDVAIGLGTVDAAYEFGLGVSYRFGMLRPYLEVRRGFGGHEGFVGETGIDLVYDPTDRIDVYVGPRATFADSEYVDTYFSVTPIQAALTGLPEFDADAGFKSAGVEATARYGLTDRIGVHGTAGYMRLFGDAADSPIVETFGDENQFSVGAGLSYRFRFDF